MSADAASQVFDSLHPKVQKWIWRQGWNSLRKVQEEAAPTLLSEDSDLIIAAATAGGKTEAAFLPILSRLLGPDESTECDGLVLYISPLKALINDQFQRLELMTEGIEIPVVPWHGDINRKDKQQFLKKSQGILLITPESLESILVNHGHR
ncbi:MAG: DEAD/DEAH box helicase, partial [Wenzhouxiangella sp.]|nr:DEAD/DEAH box helicase [Wenzhouxiangella sp.]